MCNLDGRSAVSKLDRGLSVVCAGLVPDREIGLCDLEITLGLSTGELECIETDSHHEMELLEQH